MDTSAAVGPQEDNPKGAKKGKRVVPDTWCNYVVVSDSWDGLAPAGPRKPKKEKADPAVLPANPDEPLEIPSSPEVNLIHRVTKRKETSAAGPAPPPAKKQATSRIGKRSNLDRLASKFSPGNITGCYVCIMFVCSV